MKKICLALLAVSVFAYTACEDFLEEEVVSSLTQDYYKSREGLESLCQGSYKILRYKGDYNQGEYLFGANNDIEVYSWSNADRIVNGSYAPDAWGNAVTGGQRITPFVNNLIGAVTPSQKFTEGCYPSIGACNIFLENYANLSVDDKTALAKRKGEILFLRTYSYYLISNVVGPCPLILKSFKGMPDNFYFPKASLETLYKQLIGDMRTAVELLPQETYTLTSSNFGRITKQAAAHFLSKLYLNRAQAAGWASSTYDDLKMLYKGNVTTDLDSAIYYSSLVIDFMDDNNPDYGGLAKDFGDLWKVEATSTSTRDGQKEILLSAQYEPTQTYNGRYGDANALSLTHVYNSNHTNQDAGILRDINYGRPYATLMPSDWAYDAFTDKANDSRYYKSFLTNYYTTDASGKAKTWDAGTALYYNTYLKAAGADSAKAGVKRGIKALDLYNASLENVGLVYVENSKDQPYDSLWVMSQPYVMNVRWMVGSPNNAGYFDKDGSGAITGIKAGAAAPANNPIIANYAAEGRKIYYRLAGTNGAGFGIDRDMAKASAWYMGARKWLDRTRGKGTNANGSQSFDTPIFRLAETYLIRAEAYGRKGLYPQAIADLNVLRKRAAYHPNEKRDPVLVTAEASVLAGTAIIPAAEKTYPYTVTTDSYAAIAIDGTEWDGVSAKSVKENYPVEATTTLDRFIHFIYNERGRELIFELTTTEDLHNAGILYERVRDRDMLGAKATFTGTASHPFPVDDLGGAGTVGAKGVGKGNFDRYHTFKPWPNAFLELLTDENGDALDATGKAAYQNPGY